MITTALYNLSRFGVNIINYYRLASPFLDRTDPNLLFKIRGVPALASWHSFVFIVSFILGNFFVKMRP